MGIEGVILSVVAGLCGCFLVNLVIWLKGKADNTPARWYKRLIVIEAVLSFIIFIIFMVKVSPWLLEVLQK